MENKSNLFDDLLPHIERLIVSETTVHNKRQLICALLKQDIDYFDWVGFYILDVATNELVLAEHVGKPTEHTRIQVGKGICGQVAAKQQTMIIQDVSQEDNYLSCSIDVQSEIVVPIMRDGNFIAELDIDSHALAPFTENDKAFLEKVCELINPLF